ncbi:MAG: hypothetical protein JRJ20_12940, partial [Deltaproteobacteria bacterium]|nr:hypothetical protein [Deltaproteobacteria bacterium]
MNEIDCEKPEKEYPNISKIKFTLSVSPIATVQKFLRNDNILKLFQLYSDLIYDINFTCRIAPFHTDAHGVFVDSDLNQAHLEDMLFLQDELKIKVSPVFNNVYVPPTEENLKLFVENLKPLYERGIRSITQPHSLWMRYGLLQKQFPDLEIKNTVLRRLKSAQDFWNFAELGFDYVNIDRVLMRDLKSLKEIKRAQKTFQEKHGKYVALSMLTHEGCLGNCRFWEEHYQHTLTHPGINSSEECDAVFNRVKLMNDCSSVPLYALNKVFLPPFRADLEEIAQYFDVVKVAGRKTPHAIYEHLTVWFPLLNGNGPFALPPNVLIRKCFSDGAEQIKDLLNNWRKIIKNCRFQCWDCRACEELQEQVGLTDLIEDDLVEMRL